MEIQSWLKRLSQAVKSLPEKIEVTEIADEAWVLGPKPWEESEKVPVTVLAGVHGNEWGGVGALVTWLENLTDLSCDFVGVALGNPKAIRQRVRFTETDLNRSFGRLNPQSYEHKRAEALSPLLKRTSRLLDLHQTILPSKQPFFIFPWDEEAGRLARALQPDLQIVTHRGGGFSKDGKCTDEYVLSQGGCGVTLETGCQGLDPLQIDLATRAIGSLMQLPSELVENPESVLDTLQTVSWSEGAKLLPGWENFMPVAKGDVLGNRETQALLAEVDGVILFPKYPAQNPPPAELCRIVGKADWYESK